MFKSIDPTTWNEVDGIVVAESAPAPNISGAAANVAILVGQFERGTTDLTTVGSIGQLHELYGKTDASGNLALKNKKFGRLRIARVVASDAVLATITFVGGAAVDTIKFDAKTKGLYGNSIKVTIAAGSTEGKKYTIEDTSTNAVLPIETYDDIVITAITSATFAASQLVDVTVISTAQEPDNAAATALAAGSDGTVADADYTTALTKCEVEKAGNVIFLDVYNAARNLLLKAHAALTVDKMVICAGAEADDKATALAAAALLRDTDGRLIYAYPWVQTVINSVATYTSPASWYASIISQTAPNVDPAYAGNSGFLFGVTGLKSSLTRADYIDLAKGGISAFEFISDLGPKVRSGVTTQIVNSSKTQVLRRRMSDWLVHSIGDFLRNYQNAVNSASNRQAVKAAIMNFITMSEKDGLLPKDSEVTSGLAKIVDIDSLNTDLSIGQGYFKILYKQRIYSSMRFLVLVAEIGETVVVTEGE